ncbi:MAG: hypothetical protein AAFV29_00380, partial [Myxococcota bacterium]
FASRSVVGADGYDLFWAPVPQLPTVSVQPIFQLTAASGNQWQPSVSPGGNGLAYANPNDGIFYVGRDSQIRRISSSAGQFVDSLPAVSHDGQFVAWVREDTNRPIGGTGFFETMIMIAQNDGSNARVVLEKPGIVQDAPRFEPVAGSWRIAWSEFNPNSIDATGPTVYGLWLHDFRDNVGQFVCNDPAVVIGGTRQRCFGQHLAWPRPNVLVVPQSFLEVYLDGRPSEQVYSVLLNSVQGQQSGAPVIVETAFGHTTFPVSASYLGDRMILDGVTDSVDGSIRTLGFWVASVAGDAPWRLFIDGLRPDLDLDSTNTFLFSVATPQLIP